MTQDNGRRDAEQNERELIFTARNRHVPACGTPPQIDSNAPGFYNGYFQNAHGEQLLFQYDRETRTGTVWHGDAGWDNTHNVVDGAAPSLVLDEAEVLWLKACWLAATAFDRKSDL